MQRLVVTVLDGATEGGDAEVQLRLLKDDEPEPLDADKGPLVWNDSLDYGGLDADPLAIGKTLLDRIAPSDARDDRREIWDRAVRSAEEFIFDIRAKVFRSMPWEMIGIPPYRPFLMGTVSATLSSWPAISLDPVPLPLHVLVVIGDVESDTADHELQAIYRGLGSHSHAWPADVLRQPTASQFVRKYNEVRPHVVHVIGHGESAGDGNAIRMRSRHRDESWLLDDSFVWSNLALPRLIVLNGCKTVQGDTATTLLDRSLPALIAMAGVVRPEINSIFFEEFYRTLAECASVGKAVASARWKVSLKENIADRVAWARPRLMTTAIPRTVLDIAGITDVSDDDGILENVRRFVDHTESRRELNTKLKGNDRVILVSGNSEGRSAVAEACTAIARLNGKKVVYVKFTQGDDLLERICAEIDLQVSDLASAADVPDDSQPEIVRQYRNLAPVLNAFKGDCPELILILDAISQGYKFEEFHPYFLREVTSGRHPSIRVVLVEDEEWIAANLRPGIHVRVPGLNGTQYRAAAAEFMSRHHPDADDDEGEGEAGARVVQRFAEATSSLLLWAEKYGRNEPRSRNENYYTIELIRRKASDCLQAAGLNAAEWLLPPLGSRMGA